MTHRVPFYFCDQFFVRMEGKLPEYNTRVRLLEAQTLDAVDDSESKAFKTTNAKQSTRTWLHVTTCLTEDGSEEEEANVVSREALKRQSQLIVDANSKKTWKKKGKFWSSASLRKGLQSGSK